MSAGRTGGRTEEQKAKRRLRELVARANETPEEKEARRERDRKRKSARRADAEVLASEREREKRRRADPLVKERERASGREYRARPEIKERRREYEKKRLEDPEKLAKHREVKRAHAKEYLKRPEVKARRKVSFKPRKKKALTPEELEIRRAKGRERQAKARAKEGYRERENARRAALRLRGNDTTRVYERVDGLKGSVIIDSRDGFEQSADGHHRRLPMHRSECKNGVRPCPYVSCEHHLAIHPINENRLQMPYGIADEVFETMTYTCALDIAEETAASGKLLDYEQVGAIMNMTREGVRQAEFRALVKLRDEAERLGISLEDLAEMFSKPSGAT